MSKKSLGANTIIVPTPAWVVCTFDSAGKPNGMTVAWGGICCSQPPCLAVSLRKATYTYRSILARQAFTVNVGSAEHVEAIDVFGMTSGEDSDKFRATSLTPVRSELVDAPYIDEFPLVLECQVVHTIEIGLHTQFIGKILDVKADIETLDSSGRLDIENVGPVIFNPGANTYHAIGTSLGEAFSVGRKP